MNEIWVHVYISLHPPLFNIPPHLIGPCSTPP